MNPKLKLLAWADMAKRHAAVFRTAWKARRSLDSPARTREEVEFLPGALAVQETPPHPAPRIAAWVITATVTTALLWMCVGRIDITASAQGKVAYVEGTKVVQPLETALVRRIAIRNGQKVRRGDVLIELDDSAPKADLEKARAQLALTRLEARRGRLLLAATEGDGVPRFAPDDPTTVRDTVAGHLAEYVGKTARLRANEERARAEIVSLTAQAEGLERSVPLHRTRVAQMRELADAKAVPRHELVDRELALADAEDRLLTTRNRIRESLAAAAAAQAERESYAAEFRRTAADAATQAETNAAALAEEIARQESRIRAARIVSPVDGAIQQLAIRTEGGVVSPGQPLLQVVPNEGGLTLEVMVENRDAGFIRAGQRAAVKVAAFPYTKYGLLHGVVSDISGDAVQDEKRGTLTFPARITLDSAVMETETGPVTLSPGMAVTVDIQTGRRRLIEYFFSPVLECLHESCRER